MSLHNYLESACLLISTIIIILHFKNSIFTFGNLKSQVGRIEWKKSTAAVLKKIILSSIFVYVRRKYVFMLVIFLLFHSLTLSLKLYLILISTTII